MESEIYFGREGRLAIITLNRPKALNSLTLHMIREMQIQLETWADDPDVGAVLLQGAGEKAFCAGGDVVAVSLAAKEGGDLTRVFFREEYILNRTMKTYNKPLLALIDGITMGGGVGISVHGSHRIVGDRTLFAMPETGIGLFPDVGGSYFLPRLPGRLGQYLALTGARLKAADCIYCGVGTDYIVEERMEAALAALANAKLGTDANAEIDDIVEGFASDVGEAPLAEYREAIDRCFASDDVAEVFAALAADGSDWAQKTLAKLTAMSPLSLLVTEEEMRRGAEMSFDDCMTMEYRLSQAFMAGHDFHEGIRALLIDKDKAPKWQHGSIHEVSPAEVEAYFAPLGDRDLIFD